MAWKELPINGKLFLNVQEACLSKNGAARKRLRQ